MGVRSIHCPVLGARVTHVTDLQGTVTRIMCSEYDAATGGCRCKMSGYGGPLAQLLALASASATASRGVACIFRVSGE